MGNARVTVLSACIDMPGLSPVVASMMSNSSRLSVLYLSRALIMMPGFGLAAATATLVGQNLGAKQPERAEKSSWLASFYLVTIMSTVGIFFFFFPEAIYSLFNNTPEVLVHGRAYLKILVFSYPLLAIAIIQSRALSGAGETMLPMIMTATSLFAVAIPLAYLIPAVTDLGLKGVWLAIAISHMVNGILVSIIFIRGGWKKKKL